MATISMNSAIGRPATSSGERPGIGTSTPIDADGAQAGLSFDRFLAQTHPDDLPRLREACARSAGQGDTFAIDHRICDAQGQVRHVRQQVQVVERDDDGKPRRLAGDVHDITRRRDAEEQIPRLAYYDPLTGLPDRLLFTQQLRQAIQHAERNHQQVAIMFVDLDHFKRANDTLEHGARDQPLRMVSGRLSASLRSRWMKSRALDRLMMESQLRRAIDRSELLMHYQPRVDVVTGRIVGAEALIRWQHPEKGLVQPLDFIPLVEDTGLVILIGEWVIGEVCRQIAAWQSEGTTLVSVAVNLAATHLRERRLPELVQHEMQAHGLPPGMLEIEVTESILLVEPEMSSLTAERLNQMGVRLSIDDFGTGYSSLSYLKRLPIRALKIDHSFVRDLAHDPDDAAIIARARSLKLKVVAEGVETAVQLAFLRARQCDEYQGFLMSRPMVASAFGNMLRQHYPIKRPVAA